ncbi:hypothetical protein [Thermoactinospora rubra]|uniref:hypothetical protein n=1 Tax=Thermoactinospora rubra TaxID=1088767 RepID=UPI000A1192AE|nr:hypothetical protein [Thermoactinospora rubra]
MSEHDDEFYAPVLRDHEGGRAGDTGVPGVPGGGTGERRTPPPPPAGLGFRLLAVAIVLPAGVILTVVAIVSGSYALAVIPGAVAVACAGYLVWFGRRRRRGPPVFG